MLRWRAREWLLAVAIAALPTPAHAQRGVIHERVGAVINPMGAEHMVAAGLRTPLGDPDDVLFAGAHVEAGVVDYTSPIDTRNGAYLEVSPVAFLVLRAEITSIAMWSAGMDGAGYYAVEGYGSDVRSQALPAGDGGEAAGADLQLVAILQGAIRFGPLRPILWSQTTLEHEVLGDAAFHFSPRYDRVLARSDWMLASSSMLLLEITPADGIGIRGGAYEELRYVFASGDLSNQVGPVLALSLDRVDPSVSEVLVLLRAGLVTSHATREGEWAGLAALIVHYDLGPR